MAELYEYPTGPDSRRRRIFHDGMRSTLRGLGQILFRVDIHGQEHVPPGACIVSGVHRSNLDGLLSTLVCPGDMRFMIKESMWSTRMSGWVFSTMGGFPVRREQADRAALRTAGQVLDAGLPLVVFPEGRRREGPVIENLYDGPAYLSHRHGVPIIPVGIGGSARAMPVNAKYFVPKKIVLLIGEPIQVEPRQGRRVERSAIDDGTELLTERLQMLYDEAQVMAGTPNRSR